VCKEFSKDEKQNLAWKQKETLETINFFKTCRYTMCPLCKTQQKYNLLTYLAFKGLLSSFSSLFPL
jgi:hypothetical protein